MTVTLPTSPDLAGPHAPSEWREMLRLAAPLVGANLLQMAVFAVDVLFVARLGPASLAASSLAVSIFGLLIWSLSGLVGAASPLIAAELGRRSHAVREVRRTVRMGGWAGLLAALVATGICQLGGPLLRATGQDEAVIAQAAPFLAVLSLACVPAVMASLLRTVVSTLGRPGVGTAITGLAVVVNAVGNWAFIYGHGGLPALGLIGSAWSSVVTSSAMLLAYALVLRFDRRMHRYRLLGRWWRPEWARFADVWRIGLPIFATIVAEAGLFNGAALLIGRIGETQLAAHTVAMQLAGITFQVPFGLGQAATIRVGLAYGARDHAAIARAGWTALAMSVGFMSTTAALMLAAPRLVLGLYLDAGDPANQAVLGYALQFVMVAAAFQLFDGAQSTCGAVLRGLQDTRVPMAIALFGYWVPGLLTAIGLGLFTPLGGLGVWFGLMAGLVVVAGLLLWRWHRRGALGLLP
ncbi:MATE family efflux transporter [Novosphingobium pituita]|uniref:Multidrug-efflux transporter n=1 Tax=Novosphingobium pituita TaxID=3056842 RepID=A0ABQ6PB48_9SPHN|nr:MATE family efflux transporter [Novosphingobium sp. IK01]HIQ18260.1 MATE family efflux transporter [Novosphingobium capsulatum]